MMATVIHGHRVIKNSAIGSGGMSMSRVAGTLELDGAWALTKNKDDITELMDELDAAVFEHCQAMLKKADVQARSIESNALNAEISSRLSAALRAAACTNRRESRASSNGEKQGTVTPKGTGRKRKSAQKVHDIEGSVQRAARAGLMIEWNECIDSLGEADIDGNRVILNASLPILQRLRSDENIDGLAIVAFGIYVDGLNAASAPQKHFPEFESAKFIDNWGRVLAGLPGKELVKKKASA